VSVKSHSPDNIYTQHVKQLINMVYPYESGFGSVFEDARHYFSLTPTLEAHIEKIKANIERVTNIKRKKGDAHIVEELTDKLKKNTQKLEDERLARIQRLHAVCEKIIELSEGESWDETQHLSSKFLGTLMLLTPGSSGRGFARIHQRYKPLYKAVLTLRLVDKLLTHDTISHKYLSKYRKAAFRFDGDTMWREKWKSELAIPIITAAMLQDVGLQCPQAITILKGENGDLDEFRLLAEPHRKELLKLNYHYTMKYLSDGLGTPKYVGNDRSERDEFDKIQYDAHHFLLQLVKDAFISKTGLGEVIKIPQIYASFVLSTKYDYSRLSLPKGYMLIEQLSKKGALNKQLAQDFMEIVGYFPQGFGITFIPTNEHNQEKDQFECAIVIGLNPSNPAEPYCKVVTRNQNYISSGIQETIPKNRNLYFPANRKKLMRIGRERLTEIMSQLSSNFSADSIDDLIPSYWEPYDFFGFKKHQNLWAKIK